MSDLTPVMKPHEKPHYDKIISTASSYLEFGCGGSTLLAVRAKNLNRIISVDSSKEWIDRILEHPEIDEAAKSGRLTLRHIDVGPLGDYGRPIDLSTSASWPEYYEAVFRDEAGRTADLYFVDGRFRVACVLSVILQALTRPRIVIHDFWNRPNYHPVLNFVEWVSSCGTLAEFRPAIGLDRQAALSLLHKYRFDPD